MITTIDEYIRLVYPEPKELQEDFNFFKSWGYEQYLIKKFKHDLEQLRILLMPDFNNYRMMEFFASKNSVSVTGLPLVKSRKILRRFLSPSVPKGYYGIQLWKDESGYFCIFPCRNTVLGRPIGYFSGDEIENTNLTFVNEKDLIEKLPLNVISYPFEMQSRVVYLPGYGNIFIGKTWDNDCYHGTFTIDYTPAQYNDKKKKWIYLRGKKNLTRVYGIDYNILEDVILL